MRRIPCPTRWRSGTASAGVSSVDSPELLLAVANGVADEPIKGTIAAQGISAADAGSACAPPRVGEGRCRARRGRRPRWERPRQGGCRAGERRGAGGSSPSAPAGILTTWSRRLRPSSPPSQSSWTFSPILPSSIWGAKRSALGSSGVEPSPRGLPGAVPGWCVGAARRLQRADPDGDRFACRRRLSLGRRHRVGLGSAVRVARTGRNRASSSASWRENG